MSKPITTQLDALLAFCKSEKGEATLMGAMRGAGLIMIERRIVKVRVWERLLELGDLEHIEYDRGSGRPRLKRLRITGQGLNRLREEG